MTRVGRLSRLHTLVHWHVDDTNILPAEFWARRDRSWRKRLQLIITKGWVCGLRWLRGDGIQDVRIDSKLTVRRLLELVVLTINSGHGNRRRSVRRPLLVTTSIDPLEHRNGDIVGITGSAHGTRPPVGERRWIHHFSTWLRTWGPIRGQFGMDEAASLSVWARARHPERSANFGLVLRVSLNLSNLILSMRELTLGTIPASVLFLPASA